MQHLKVRKIGNSLGVVLPKEVLAKLGVAEGDELMLAEAPDGQMSIVRSDPGFAEEIAAAERIMDRYRNALAELSKR